MKDKKIKGIIRRFDLPMTKKQLAIANRELRAAVNESGEIVGMLAIEPRPYRETIRVVIMAHPMTEAINKAILRFKPKE